jgi:hypothetical protein
MIYDRAVREYLHLEQREPDIESSSSAPSISEPEPNKAGNCRLQFTCHLEISALRNLLRPVKNRSGDSCWIAASRGALASLRFVKRNYGANTAL